MARPSHNIGRGCRHSHCTSADGIHALQYVLICVSCLFRLIPGLATCRVSLITWLFATPAPTSTSVSSGTGGATSMAFPVTRMVQCIVIWTIISLCMVHVGMAGGEVTPTALTEARGITTFFLINCSTKGAAVLWSK